MDANTSGTTDFVAAFIALLVRSQDDGVHVLPVIPRGWEELSFDQIRCESGFIVGADVRAGVVVEVRVQSENDGLLRLHPNTRTHIEHQMTAGETWVWRTH